MPLYFIKAARTIVLLVVTSFALAINIAFAVTLVTISPEKGKFAYTIQLSKEAKDLIEAVEPYAAELKVPKSTLAIEFKESSNEFMVFESLRVLIKERTKFDKILPTLLQASLPCLEAFIYLASINSPNFDLVEYAVRTGNETLLRLFIEKIGISASLKGQTRGYFIILCGT